MPDNWSYVFAAYAVAAVVFGAYWRRLARREREVGALEQTAAPPSVPTDATDSRASRPGPPRFEPGTRTPLP